MLGMRLEETRVYREAKAEGEQIGEERGRQEGATSLVLRQLARRLQQVLPEEMRSRIAALPLAQLEALGEALLDFSTMADLEAWLAEPSEA